MLMGKYSILMLLAYVAVLGERLNIKLIVLNFLIFFWNFLHSSDVIEKIEVLQKLSSMLSIEKELRSRRSQVVTTRF